METGATTPLAARIVVTAHGHEIERAALRRHSEGCPRCEGVITEEDIQIVEDECGLHAALSCPHCGFRASKLLDLPKGSG